MKGHSSGERELQSGTDDNGVWDEAEQGVFPVFWPWTVLRKSGCSCSPVMTWVALGSLLNLGFNTRLQARAAPVALLPWLRVLEPLGELQPQDRGMTGSPAPIPNVTELFRAELVDE